MVEFMQCSQNQKLKYNKYIAIITTKTKMKTICILISRLYPKFGFFYEKYEIGRFC